MTGQQLKEAPMSRRSLVRADDQLTAIETVAIPESALTLPDADDTALDAFT